MVLFSQNPDLPAERWQARTVSGPATEMLVDNLTSDATFHFRVQSRNTIGYSPTSSNSVFYTKSLPGGKDVFI
jgi:chitodextrinase